MSDEKVENKPLAKPVEAKPQETSQTSKPQEKTTEVRPVELSESFANKAGDQGVFFSPAVGISTPDPFVAQDVTPSQPPPSQTIAPTPPPAQPATPTQPVPSGGGDSSGE
ncbi:MAG: hypothetical protein L0287_00265 [Anaerolineae bacterium]|nr:hypothetical protein [Anaerolineae bacterium]MCI0607942.1 hypothetical protein [Anaerolineae bacterium]